ncbi:MAG: hypothetical protein MAG453_00374 [Calditrichaeota bacterium]|nr:hypothetical protein [Calditrichota bacterium]
MHATDAPEVDSGAPRPCDIAHTHALSQGHDPRSTRLRHRTHTRAVTGARPPVHPPPLVPRSWLPRTTEVLSRTRPPATAASPQKPAPPRTGRARNCRNNPPSSRTLTHRTRPHPPPTPAPMLLQPGRAPDRSPVPPRATPMSPPGPRGPCRRQSRTPTGSRRNAAPVPAVSHAPRAAGSAANMADALPEPGRPRKRAP